MTTSSLRAEGITAGYGRSVVLQDLDLSLPGSGICAIVGANACGKSTLLRCLSRLLRPDRGQVLLDGRSLRDMPTRELARLLGLLPQSPTAPDGISVADLVGYGLHPHQGVLSRWSAADDRAVADALEATGSADLADRSVDELSGGQRQRVWIAMALAQHTDILLLDEPTTFLDIAHQIEVLDLLVDLARERGTRIIMVLHDLNLSARYADQLIVMREGRIDSFGAPADTLTEAMIERVFELKSRIITDPTTGKPMMLPLGRHGTT